MPVIAMTHEMGSLARDVSAQLAQTGGLDVMRHEVLENVASKMHVPSSLISRLREGKAGLVERLTTDSERVAVYTAEEVYALAAKGNIVLRGWGATCLLRPVSHVLRVRVTRSFERRVDWLMESVGTSDRDFAAAEVRRSDAAHASRMHALFGVTWGDPVLYDLVLNSDRLSVESCVALILQLAARPEFQETAQSQAALHELALTAKVRAALKDHEATRGVDIAIDSKGGKVTLGGIVVNDAERAEVVRIATDIAGAGNVDSKLQLMKLNRRFASTDARL